MTHSNNDQNLPQKRTCDAKRIANLIAALEAEQHDLEENRETLRRKMAEVEYELGQLTSQQAELQKVQIALDRLLKYLLDELDPQTQRLASLRLTGLADAAAKGTC